jgi:hypothetical protein
MSISWEDKPRPLEAKNLEKAVRRHWFRSRDDAGKPYGDLSRSVQNAVMGEALEIQAEDDARKEEK